MALVHWVSRYCRDLTRIWPHHFQSRFSASFTQAAANDEVLAEGTQSPDEPSIEESQHIEQDDSDRSGEAIQTSYAVLPDIPKAPSSHESPSFLHDPVVMKFVNCMMWDGKKSLSQNILREALEVVKKSQISKLKSGSVDPEEVVVDPLVVFHQAVENAKPLLGTSSVKKGGKIYLVPHPLAPKRRQFLGIKWLIKAARERKGNGMAKKLGAELLDAYNSQGTVIKRKQDLHRVAEANRAFAHFRW